MKDVEAALRAAGSEPGSPPPDAIDRLIAQALDEVGGVVAYAEVDSPFGRLLAAGTDRGLVRLSYPGEDAVLQELADRLTPRILEAPARLDRVRRELEEYFDGGRHRFEVPIDWALVRGGFSTRVLRATARIPFGATRTYADVARRAGSPRASRAAGNALGANPIPIVVPCHRVIHADGGLGGYTGGLERKERLLRLEGVLDG